MVEGIPNLACVFGYANAPWTLKADLTAALCLSSSQAHGCHRQQTVAVPHDAEDNRTSASILGTLSSGYVQRGEAILPRQGSRYSWHVSHHYGPRPKNAAGRSDRRAASALPQAARIRCTRSRREGAPCLRLTISTPARSPSSPAPVPVLAGPSRCLLYRWHGARVHCADIHADSASRWPWRIAATCGPGACAGRDRCGSAVRLPWRMLIYAEEGRVDLLFNNAGIGRTRR